jgi:hypothetical protein
MTLMKEGCVLRISYREGRRWSLARRGLLLATASLLLIGAAAACGGDDDDDTAGDRAVMSTFTPVPPDFTPEVIQTRSAQETAYSATQTAEPNVTATAPAVTPVVGTPDGSPVEGTPQATAQPGEVRPPEALLRTPGGEVAGAIGSSNFLDPVLGSGASIEAPYVPLPSGAVSWATGSTASIHVPNSPYPVQSATVEIYSFDENVARPTQPDGTPTGELAFFPQTEPSQEFSIDGATLNLVTDVPAGNYIVSARIIWGAPPEIVAQFEEQFTQYVFVVRVG